ncbi:MAG: hypothetical protein ABFD89_06035 [Bryobacteraceae bacterium]
MSFNPSLPQNNAPIVAAELRGQFQAIQDNIDAVREHLNQIEPLNLTVSNPPTQAQVQAIANKLDELINTLMTV